MTLSRRSVAWGEKRKGGGEEDYLVLLTYTDLPAISWLNHLANTERRIDSYNCLRGGKENDWTEKKERF